MLSLDVSGGGRRGCDHILKREEGGVVHLFHAGPLDTSVSG